MDISSLNPKNLRDWHMFSHRDPSVSEVHGTILFVVIVVLLLLVLLAYLMGFTLPKYGCECNAPELIKITTIDNGLTSMGRYRSIIAIQNTGPNPLPNDDLSLELLINGEKTREISTLNGHNFISTHHYGVQTIGGIGSHNQHMVPRSIISINFADNTIFPGELVTVRIYQKGEGRDFVMDAGAFLNRKCRDEWVIYSVHKVYPRPPCPISEHSMVSP